MKKNRQPDESNTRHGRAIGRRDFLTNAALLGAGLAIGPSAWAASSDQQEARSDKGLPRGGKQDEDAKAGKPGTLRAEAARLTPTAGRPPPVRPSTRLDVD